MTPEQRERLENLVFSPLDPFLSLDNRLQSFLDLINDIVLAERERCAQIAENMTADNDPQDVAAAIRKG